MSARSWQHALRLSRAELAVLGCTLAYMAAWLVAALVLGNREFIFYFVVMCVLIAAVGAVHLRVRFPMAALWGLSAWGLAHMAGGLMPTPAGLPINGQSHVLYNLWLVPGWLKYDQLVHAYGFGLVTWICWWCLAATLAGRSLPSRPSLGLLTLCAAAGMGFGAMNEVVEFIATLTLPGTNVGGYINTGWDLVANLVGSVTAGVLIYLRGRAKGARGAPAA